MFISAWLCFVEIFLHNLIVLSSVAVAPGRWIVRGSFHEGDTRFPEDHRGRQATPCSLMALGMSHVVDPNEWTAEDIDEVTATDML